MKCPVCDTNLQMTERSSVEIDYCPTCRGVWLDRGELDKIIERSGSEMSNRSSSDRPRKNESYDSSSQSREYSEPRKKESFWSELFDFG